MASTCRHWDDSRCILVGLGLLRTAVAVMKDESTDLGGPAADATNAPSLPSAVDRATFQAELDGLRVRQKAHTRESDAIAAARRRLPMVEVDPNLALIGPDGPLTLLDALFVGRALPLPLGAT